MTWTDLDPLTTYTITETAQAAYTGGPISCAGGAGSFTPAPGEVITCTVTNTDNRVTDIGVTKTHNVGEVDLGGLIVWTLTVTNIGPAAATDVVIHDALPTGLDLLSVTPAPGWDCTESVPGPPAVVHCEKASMAVGETAVFTVATSANASMLNSVVNSVSVETSTREIVLSNNEATSTVVAAELPETGRNMNGLAGFGVLLLGVGAAFQLLGRRGRARRLHA